MPEIYRTDLITKIEERKTEFDGWAKGHPDFFDGFLRCGRNDGVLEAY